MWILGISYSHNSGAALIKDGEVVVAVQTERLTRFKRQSIWQDRMGAETVLVIAYCLRHAGIDLPDIQAIATCTPTPSVPPRFVLVDDEPEFLGRLPGFMSVPHHLAHAEYALHYAPPRPCLVLVCDGSGTCEADRTALDIQEQEYEPVKFLTDRGAKESISAYSFDGADLRLIYRVAYGPVDQPAACGVSEIGRRKWQASLGHLWEWSALYCHGSRHEAGKVMGLAPFGDPHTHAHLRSISIDRRGLVNVDFMPLLRDFRLPNLSCADVSGVRHYEDVAAHIQHQTNRFLVELVQFLGTLHSTSHLCYSGGVALNGIANEYLRRALDLNLYMNGSCEDNGTAVGAALAAYHALTGRRVFEPVTDFHGRRYSSEDVAEALQGFGGQCVRMRNADLLRRTARSLAAGQVVAWFQGRSEFGPRALGNRSILADPRNPNMQQLLNGKVKRREAFRPYAPAVVEERASEFFDLGDTSPVMLRVVPTRVDTLPAITHIDGTARVQTVSRAQNAIFYDLLKAFESESGVPVLLNTSLNGPGEPIVETPADALRTFLRCGMDALVMEDYFIVPEAGETEVPRD